MSYLMYFHDFFSTFFQLHNQAGTEEQKKIWIFFVILFAILDFSCHSLIIFGYFWVFLARLYIMNWCLTSCTFTIFFQVFSSFTNQAETEKHVKSKTKQNLDFFVIFGILYAILDFSWHFLIIFGYFCVFLAIYYELMSLPHVLSRFFFQLFSSSTIRRRQRNMSSPKQNKIWNWVPKIRSWHNLSNNCIKVSLQLIR